MFHNQNPFVSRHDADLDGIIDILKYRRAPRTESHRQFLAAVLKPIFGKPDAHGNYTRSVGHQPSTAFMAHHDTVETASGFVSLHIDPKQVISISPEDKLSRCLGADDGAGIWLILEMIRADRPGLYIIFADEESGCRGSSALAKSNPNLFNGATSAISFDRHAADGNQVITKMAGSITASAAYAEALCTKLGLGYVTSDNGGSTDSKKFLGVGSVQNATNVTVAYRDHHSRCETLDFFALRQLRNRLIAMDFSDLPTMG